MREDFDSVWSEWFGEAESLATDIGAVITIPRICKYQHANNAFKVTTLGSSVHIAHLDTSCHPRL